MKITVVHGQAHKGSTWKMSQILLKNLGKGHEVTEFFLPTDFREVCIGCVNCILESEELCPHRASVVPIECAIEEAELLVFTTPTYVLHTTGAMKSLLDHFAYRWITHRPSPLAYQKQAVVLSTSAGSTTKHAIQDIKHSLSFWGVGRIHTYGIAVAAFKWEEISDQKRKKIQVNMEKIAVKILHHAGTYHATLMQKFCFLLMRRAQTNPWNKKDEEWWHKQGYLDGKIPWKK